MSTSNKVKIVKNILPSILKHGECHIILQSSIKPQVKISTSSCIKVLKQVAYHNKIVSLSANQIGLDQRVFVALKPQFIKPGKWRNYQNVFEQYGINKAEDAYEGIVSIVEANSSYQHYYAFQQCPSHPGLKFKVKIPLIINVRYLTEKVLLEYLHKITPHSKKQIKTFDIPQQLFTYEKLVGFRGRVWDHQIRHLQGLLPIHDKVCDGSFYLLDDYKNSIQNLQYYENLKQIQIKFEDKNLKKLQKQKKKQYKQKSKGKNKQLNKLHQSLNFMDSIKETIDQSLHIPNIKNKQMKKVVNNEKNPNFMHKKNIKLTKNSQKK